MVPPIGLEPTTLCSEDRCSNPLSYGGKPLVIWYTQEDRDPDWAYKFRQNKQVHFGVIWYTQEDSNL